MSICRKKTCRQMHAIASVRRCATVRMGSGGSVWAKSSTTQCIDCLTFEDLLRVALWHRFGSLGHERWPVVWRRRTTKLESKAIV
eukprot:595100-Amphidinium_carterae.1